MKVFFKYYMQNMYIYVKNRVFAQGPPSQCYPQGSRTNIFSSSSLIFAVRRGKIRIYNIYSPPELIFKFPHVTTKMSVLEPILFKFFEWMKTTSPFRQNTPRHIACSLQEGQTFRIPQRSFQEYESRVCPFS